MDETKLQYLLDRTEISETVTRYFCALDQRDWPAMRATLASRLDVDFEQHFGEPAAEWDSDEFVAYSRDVLSGFAATQHLNPSHVIDVDGDDAVFRAYMQAWHTVPTPHHLADTFLVRGHYRCAMVRTPEGWRMRALTITVIDQEGDKGIYAVARERYASRATD